MLKYNCRYFTGNRPCKFHKKYEIKCDSCDYYYPIGLKILIIKLDALGDVLRTTSILPALKKKYSSSYITWCTRENALELFINNEFVNEVIIIERESLYMIMAQKYDLVINLDNSKLSSAIASKVLGKEKVGFILNAKGYVEPTSEPADKWLEMSAFDDVKRGNKKTYQQIMYDILGLKSEISIPILKVPIEVKENMDAITKRWSFNQDFTTLGLNIGVGKKWTSKAWPLERWKELIELLKRERFNLLLLGGSDEKNKMQELLNSRSLKSV